CYPKLPVETLLGKLWFGCDEDGAVSEMSGNLNTILFQLTILFFYTPHCHSQLLCAEFHFPGLADSTITRIETSSLVLPFRLTRTSWCLKDTLKNFDIEVVKQHKRSEHISCRITHVNGECSVTSVRGSPCTCPEDGVYTFAKTTDRRDSGEWIWRTPGENTKEKSLTFNIELSGDVVSRKVVGISTAGAGALCIVTACVVTCVVMRRRLSTCGVSGARKDKPARSLRKCDNPCQRSSGTTNGYYESGDGVDDLEMGKWLDL
ncbi:hypothetical protein BaRGS_00038429, partial [Batillaria attramentaria]